MRLGAWNEAWTPPGCGPVEYLDRLRAADVAAAGRARRRTGRRRPRQARACGRDHRHVPAQQPLDRRGNAADRAVLLVGGARRDRHRQPGERRGSERVCRAGGRPTAGAARAGGAHPRERDDCRAPRRSALPSEFGTIAPGKRADLIAVRVPRGVMMWKNTCCRGSSRRHQMASTWLGRSLQRIAEPAESGRLCTLSTENPEHVNLAESTDHLRLVRALQPFGVRAAVCADRGVARTASARRLDRASVAAPSAGSSSRWWPRGVPRWDSTGWRMRRTTR